MRRLLTISALLLTLMTAAAIDWSASLPRVSELLPGYDSVDSVKRRLNGLPLASAEGVWQLTPDGAMFAIERVGGQGTTAPTRFQMVMIESPLPHILPGTVLGRLSAGATPGSYEAWVYTSLSGEKGLELPAHFVARVSDDGRLTLKPIKTTVRFTPWRALPWMFRRVVEVKPAERPDGLDGAVRVHPVNVKNPLAPVYL